MQKDNRDLSEGLQKKDTEVKQLQHLVDEMDKFMKKAHAASKNNSKQKRDIKDKDRVAHKMRKEIIELKHQNTILSQMVKELKASQVIVR